MGYPYAYGQPIRVRVSHTHMGCQYAYGLPICIWGSPYAYGQNTCMGRNIYITLATGPVACGPSVQLMNLIIVMVCMYDIDIHKCTVKF